MLLMRRPVSRMSPGKIGKVLNVNKSLKTIALGAMAIWCGPACAAERVSFGEQVLPILSNKCFKCHGDSIKLSGLDLRDRDSVLKGGQHGAAIIPGNADQSKLYRLITGKEKPAMPLDGTLADNEIALLRDWINQGAVWDRSAAPVSSPTARSTKSLEDMEIPPEARAFWAFQEPVRRPTPAIKDAAWSRNPIDAFLRSAMEGSSVRPAPAADKRTLIRRAYLDLIGLPPTPEEISVFVKDTSPDAWEKLIDRLLALPAYGERWGRHWLDVARYADSSGYEHDFDRPVAWRYRDYVIKAFNSDKPYDVFVKEQLAGDEMESSTLDSKIATGFLRVGPRVEYREKDFPSYRFEYLDDMISTTSQAFLGMTVQCARCHNHKFDPIPQKDYYRLQATFFPYVDVNYYLASPAEIESYEAKQQAIDRQAGPLRAQIAEIEAPYIEKAFFAKALSHFPEDVQIALKTPADRRTPGQKLIADQLLHADQVLKDGGVKTSDIDPLMTSEDKALRDDLRAKLKALDAQRPKKLPYAMGITDGDYRFAPDGPGDQLTAQRGAQRNLPPDGSFLHRSGGPFVPLPSYFLIRGDLESRGSEMQPGFLTVASHGNQPTAIPPSSGYTSGRRRALAEWITSHENPLAARVMVNRIWYYHFGRGIVRSLNNFGKMGERPTHPELLDWLANEFMSRGWSIKDMHRLMMTSNAYKMKSNYDDASNQKTDPENNLLWKFRLQRLDAEALRDTILAVSGKLNREMGGPPVFPKVDHSVLASMKNGIWKTQEDGPAVWRRSLYIYRKRGMPFPMFEVFDLPDQNVTCAGRNVSTVPTQALALLNDEFVLKQARFFAERVLTQTGASQLEQLKIAYELALGRDASEPEREIALKFLKRQREFHLAQNSKSADLDSLTDLTHVIFNLDEFVYIT